MGIFGSLYPDIMPVKSSSKSVLNFVSTHITQHIVPLLDDPSQNGTFNFVYHSVMYESTANKISWLLKSLSYPNKNDEN